ncbi:ATP synthase peripheral stalk subunit b, mitochondrial [Ciona intestinalis]
MLSRILFKAGRPVSSCVRVAARMSSSTPSTLQVVDKNYPARVQDWENFKMPGAPYEGMGPLPPVPDFDENLVRHYVIPEYWFDFLYPRTGATGMYTLMAGFSAMLVSKEFFVYTPDAWYAATLLLTVAGLNKVAGKDIRNLFDNMRTDELKALDQVKSDQMEHIKQTVDEIKLEQWRSGSTEMINDALKNNLAMMLETEYLNRQATVVEAVKRKLDYQVEVQKVDSQLAHGHMVKWIEEKVMNTITPASQKTTLAACIAQLNAMPAK